MLIFSLINLVIDVVMLLLFYSRQTKNARAHEHVLPSNSTNSPKLGGLITDSSSTASSPRFNEETSSSSTEETVHLIMPGSPKILLDTVDGSREQNFQTALMHQVTDTIRTVTVLTGTALVLIFDWDAATMDAVCALIVSLFVFSIFIVCILFL